MAKPVIWSTEARADIRAIDRDTALRLLKAVTLQQAQVDLVVGGVEKDLLAPVASLRDVVGDSFNDDTGDARPAWKCSHQRISLA